MKTKMKTLLLLILCCCMLALTSCGKNDSKEGTELVIILGKHANANFSNEVLDKTREYIEESFSYWKDSSTKKYCAKANVSIIVSDGDPDTVPIIIDGNADENETMFTQTNTTQKRKKNVDNIIDNIIDYMKSDDVMADDPDVDLLAAIREARHIFHNSDLEEQQLIIIDTGITTTGYLDMFNMNIQGKSVDTIVDESINEKAYVDLDGVNVVFWGLGNVAEPQMRPKDTDFETQLEELWTSILCDKCNAKISKENRIKYGASEGEALMASESGYPSVKAINFELIKMVTDINTGGIEYNPDNPLPKPETGISLTSEEIKFIGDSDEFANPTDASTVLDRTADVVIAYLNSYPESVVYVVGSIARTIDHPEAQDSNEWSQKRSEKIVQELVNRNIDNKRLKAIDAGSLAFSWRNTDEFENGKWKDSKAQMNRLVRIIPDCVSSEIKELEKAGCLE